MIKLENDSLKILTIWTSLHDMIVLTLEQVELNTT